MAFAFMPASACRQEAWSSSHVFASEKGTLPPYAKLDVPPLHPAQGHRAFEQKFSSINSQSTWSRPHIAEPVLSTRPTLNGEAEPLTVDVETSRHLGYPALLLNRNFVTDATGAFRKPQEKQTGAMPPNAAGHAGKVATLQLVNLIEEPKAAEAKTVSLCELLPEEVPPLPTAGVASQIVTGAKIPTAEALQCKACDSDSTEVPEVGSPDLPSRGSALHQSGTCRPCAFFHKGACQNGLECSRCHLCGPDEKARRINEWKERKRNATKQCRMLNALNEWNWVQGY